MGSQPVGGGKRHSKSKKRRLSSHRSVDTRAAVASASARVSQGGESEDPNAAPRNPSEAGLQSSPKSAHTPPTNNAPSEVAKPSEDPELGVERERILSQMSANWSMESEFFRSREEVMAQLRYSLDFLDTLESSARQRLERIQSRRVDLDTALRSVAAIEEENWTAETVDEECQAALRVISDARMEWRHCCLQWPELRGASAADSADQLTDDRGAPLTAPPLTAPNMVYLCKLGFAFTWPLGLAVLILGVVFALTR